MVPVRFDGPEELTGNWFGTSGWRCVNCGERIDPLILENRRVSLLNDRRYRTLAETGSFDRNELAQFRSCWCRALHLGTTGVMHCRRVPQDVRLSSVISEMEEITHQCGIQV